MRTPAVLYAAKSTQDKHKSIPKQLEDGRKKAAEEGWEILDEFRDEGFSAYSGNRGPGLKAATALAESAAAERSETCMLVTQHSDRFARGAGDRPGASDSLVEIWSRMRRVNVHLRSFQNDSMMGDVVLVAVASKQAHEESQRKSDAVKDGLTRRRHERGKPQGGKRRFAYRWANGELIAVEAERAIVARMFEEFLAGRSDSAIMRGLVAEGISTALGGRWHAATVRDILTNPLYAGMLRTKDGVVKGAHEPCISMETFEKAEALRKERSKTGKGRGRPVAGKHLFRKGMLRCGRCEGSMVPRTTRPGKSRPGRAVTETYYCYEHHRDKSLCPMTPISREVVDVAVYRYFAQVGLDVEATRAQVAGSRERKLEEIRALREQAQREKRHAEERLGRVRRDYQNGKLEAEDWTEQRDELAAELDATSSAVERLLGQEAEIDAWADLQDAERDTLTMLSAIRQAIAGEVADASSSIDAVRAALTRLFEAFVVQEVALGQRVHADLAWRGGFVIEPVVREQAVEGYSTLRPIFRREPLYDAENNSGLAQFMPATAAAYGLHDPFDPEAAIDAQAHLMSDLLAQFDGSPTLALAAYNAGPAPVEACDCVPDYPETQTYVTRILALLGGAGALTAPTFEVRLVS
jgi:DNA invertase Pin-like site-specific DNA recombinase